MEYGFAERLQMSHGTSAGENIGEILCKQIPAALKVEKATEREDRCGTDWWVNIANGHRLSVDCKVRSKDYLESEGKDDLALETWSVVEKKIVGWSRDAMKRTDYVMWFWQPTGRWCLVPFPMLCTVFAHKWQEWCGQFKTAQQFTTGRNYHSEVVYVPRRTLWRAIYERYGGVAVCLK